MLCRCADRKILHMIHWILLQILTFTLVFPKGFKVKPTSQHNVIRVDGSHEVAYVVYDTPTHMPLHHVITTDWPNHLFTCLSMLFDLIDLNYR